MLQHKQEPGPKYALRYGGFLLLLAAAAALYVLWPAPQAAPPAPRPEPAPAVEAPPEEPEEGTSARRVRWTEVEVDPRDPSWTDLAGAGEALYIQKCLVCHGAEGKGDGPAARREPRPRNFTRGFYKFKTSLPGEMPFDDDLYRTITAGIPAASMPSFAELTPFERWALVAFVKELTRLTLEDGRVIDHFERSPATERMPFSPPPEPAAFDPRRGESLFRTAVQCAQCHGPGGKGDGPAASNLTDAFDQPIGVPDLTRGEVTFKAGERPEDIFRVLTTGMAGTPMPSFAAIPEKDRWELAHYVTSLYRPIPEGERIFLRVGCTSCHTIGQGKIIGPDLAGVMQRHDKEWMRRWLKDPPVMLATDPKARKLLEEYLTPMPSYGLNGREIERLIEFMETFPPAPAAGGREGGR